MPLILSIALGLIFALVIGVMALGIVAFARDHCDETLPSANVGADFTGSPRQGEALERGVFISARQPNQPKSVSSVKESSKSVKSVVKRPRDSRGRFIKKTPSRP